MFCGQPIKTTLKYLTGFLPLNKPKGIECASLIESFRLDLYNTVQREGLKIGQYEVCYSRYLEPFASGLITISIGSGNTSRRNFIFAKYRYRTTVEFGVSREGNCVLGNIVSEGRVDHLNSELIEREANKFVGTVEQFSPESVRIRASDDLTELQRAYLQLRTQPDLDLKEAKPRQKYPPFMRPRDVVCDSIHLVEYSKPFATFDIACEGSFCIRSFVGSLAEALETQANVVELTRVQEGPMHLDDLRVMQLEELNYDCYIERLPGIQSIYTDYIGQFDGRFERDSSRKRNI